MALSDRWTRMQLVTAVRGELMDAGGRWWTDTELTSYLDDWQNDLQTRFEFVLSTSTTTTSLTTNTYPSDALRVDNVCFNNVRLLPRPRNEMEWLQTEWRNEGTSTNPYVVIVDHPGECVLWPPLTSTGTLSFEYLKQLSLPNTLSVMEVPAWTKYSAINYCVWRAYARAGINHDINRALRSKSRYERQCESYRRIHAAHFPSKQLLLRPGGQYEAAILNPKPYGSVTMPVAVSLRHQDEVPSGSVDGVNPTFTLTYTPDPSVSLKVWVGGVLYTQNTHYALSSNIITFINPYQPETGQAVFTTYRYITT